MNKLPIDGSQDAAPITLIGDQAYLYIRFAKAAATLRSTGDAHMKAQDEYKQALGLWSAACEKAVNGS